MPVAHAMCQMRIHRGPLTLSRSSPALHSAWSSSCLSGVPTLRMHACVQMVLLIRVGVHNPLVTKSFVAGNMEGKGAEELEDMKRWRDIMVLLQLSSEQKRQMIELRQCFLAKLREILDRRRSIHTDITVSGPPTPDYFQQSCGCDIMDVYTSMGSHQHALCRVHVQQGRC